MYCPKCATKIEGNQKFCRSCGFNLEIISEIFNNESLANQFELSLTNVEQFKNQKKRLEIWGVIIVILSLLVGCLIPILIGIGIPNLNAVIILLAGIAGLILFAGVILLIYKDMPLKESVVDKFSPSPILPRTKHNKELASADFFEPLSSVTERTTDRLEINKIKVRHKNHNR